MGNRLGQLLVRENLISLAQLKKAQDLQSKEGGRLAYALTKLGYLAENDLTDFLSKQYGVPSISLGDFEIDPAVIRLIPKEVAEKHQVIAVNRAGSSLIVAMADPSNIFAVDDIKFLTGYNVEVVVAAETAIKEAIRNYYAQEEQEQYASALEGFEEGEIEVTGDDDDESVNILDLENQAEEAPVVKLVNLMLIDAIKKHASDIHVEVYEKYFRVRYRIDGVLYEVMKPPLRLKNAIVSRLKIMSELDIAERRLPQDGRMKLKLGKGREMDFRVSVLPTLFGEKVVLRLLDKENLQLDMTKLGFDMQPLADFKDAIHRPWGMILVTGPTGSGKTTTLYSAMTELNTTEVNICTAEDPVEYQLKGINQVHMHEDIGLNFASALRAFLRQDPDIIMVGEIRDFETAEIGIKAALTGHLVLSTLHTNDAPSSISRLLNMGVEPFLVVAAIISVMAQRLCRRVCKECAEPIDILPQRLIDAGMDAERANNCKPVKGRGCKACSNTGYKGRVAMYEVMPFKDELKDFVLNGASAVELKREAVRLGMQTLRQSALHKLYEQITSFDEVLRNTSPD
ncbi:MAG: type IV-A pilus assembly ATPase PilB [Myxococcales bacterium]|nr:MAG: type IV-A pilus assembly ATPase PilB [Myxococcales bacterium]